MKPYHIALFKHYVDGHGMTTPFINMYRSYPIKKNPKLVEDYLKEADEHDVFMHAFYFIANHRWGYEYWLEFQRKFLEYLKEHEDDEEQDTWYELHGKCKILRTNWDTKHWKMESKAVASMRLGIEYPEYMSKDKEEEDDKDLIEFTDKEEEKPKGKTIQEYLHPQEKSILGEFSFMDLRPRSHDARRLGDDELSVNTRGNRGRITFNQKMSKEIKARGGYEYAALMKNNKGEILIILNDEKGVNLQDGGKSRENINVTIGSKVLVEKVVTYLDIKREYEIIKAKEIEKTKDYVAYLLTTINK